MFKHLVSRQRYYPGLKLSPCRRLQLSTLSTDRPRYKHIDDVERLDYYERGGYHPIQVGDHLNRRYRIVHKLGHGSYSTIWLAKDEQSSKYVALKVGTASSNHKEIDILSRLANHASKEKSFYRALVHLLADAKLASDHQPFRIDVARSIAAQLAMVVAYMHSVRLVHGDLHFGNLLLQLPSKIDGLTDQQLYDQYEPPEPEPVVREDEQPLSSLGIPSNVYTPIWTGKPSDEISLDESKLLLNDFGTAFYPDEEKRFDSYTPLEIRPPEARFEPTKPLSFPSDVWSLGCMIWAILGVKPFLGAWLFGPDTAAASQIDALGPMPDEWWEKWEAKTKTESFDGNGKPKPGRGVSTFEKRFEDGIQKPRREEGMETIAEDEREAIFKMIKSMLKFRPGERMSAQNVLETEWMRKWAIPSAEKSIGKRGSFQPVAQP